MTIAEIEQRYQQLRAEYLAGRMEAAAFEAAVAGLQFQDAANRYWTLGAQSGTWYYYDGAGWHPADPRQAHALPAPAPAVTVPGPLPGETGAAKPAGPGRSRRAIVMANVGLMLLAVLILVPLLVLPVGATPGLLPPAAPSPRPPLDNGGGGGSSGGDGGGGGGGVAAATAPSTASNIVGTVTDLSSGRPAAGVEVAVNGALVRTDTDGSYSVTGLPAGDYTVLPELPGGARPAQGPVSVKLDGFNDVTLDLGFYSQPAATDTPQPAAAAKVPAALPPAGGPARPWPGILSGLGLVLIAIGGLMRGYGGVRREA